MPRRLESPRSRPAGARMIGLGAYRPHRVVSNEEVCAPLDVDADWVLARSGIRTRRFAGPDETVVDMAAWAAADALVAAEVPADAIDVTLVATMSQDTSCPQVSPRITARLGVTGPAMDLGAACSGFCYGLELASSLIRAGSARHVLVVGVERMSDLLAPHDRSTAFLFGDGAGAVVVGPSDEPGIGPPAWGADGDQAELIVQSPTWLEAAADDGPVVAGLRMQGPAVFRWATTQMVPVIEQALSLAGLKAEQLDAFVPHQANNRITDRLVKALDLPEHVVVARDVADTGNTSAASVPLAMESLLAAGRAQPGDLALLAGFGAGLTYAAAAATLPAIAPAR